LEVKNASASSLMLTVSRQAEPELYAVGCVSSFMKNRGIRTLEQLVFPVNVLTPKSRPDAGKSLEWLAKSVQPCVRSLIARGYRERVVSALGLTEADLRAVD